MIQHKHRRRVAALLAAGFAGSLVVVASPAGATGNGEDAGTEATVAGTGIKPSIQCAWALPDWFGNWNSNPRMTYGIDDDFPAAPADAPCKFTDGVGVTQAPSTTPIISVTPNPEDDPTQRFVELWVAADYEFGRDQISSVVFDVWHPDGSLKINVQGSSMRCQGPTGMFASAVLNGIFSANAVNDNDFGIKNKCIEGNKGLWYGAFGLSKHQPYGDYKVTASVSTNQATVETQTFYIKVNPLPFMAADFNKVNYGNLLPNTPKIVDGDFIFSKPQTTVVYNGPGATLKSVGNAGIGFQIAFERMCAQTNVSLPLDCDNDPAKRVDRFDAAFAANPDLHRLPNSNLNLYTIPLIQADETTAQGAGAIEENDWHSLFGEQAQAAHYLCPNDVGKLDLSVHPEALSVTASPYKGKVYLRLVSKPNCRTDQGKEYVANGYDGVTPQSNNHWPV